MPSASQTVAGKQERGRLESQRYWRRSNGESRPWGRLEAWAVRRAWNRECIMEEGRCGLEPPRKPMALCASWSTNASWSFSPPVPALVCSWSPVRHCKQLHGRLAPMTVNPALPPCWDSSLKAKRTFLIKVERVSRRDVWCFGSTLTPPGLPLRDPPRMAGSYGVSLNDPVFGISSGSIPCENPGHRPIPAQAPIPPPPPQQRVGDPVAQVLVGQGAMSHLLIQTAQEMNRRTVGQGAGEPSQSSGQGSTSGGRKEMKMDEKWIPSMPIASWKNWTSRGKELSGFKSWLEQFSGWLCLIHDAYGTERSHQLSRSDSIL